jgi:N-acetylmuramoyl-L-alanine amidase
MRRVWIPSPNYSSRGGAGVRLVVLHTAEGARTYQELGAFFGNSGSGVSSQVGIDDTPDTIGEYVAPGFKAWTQGNANPVAVSAELCAFAEWSPAEWDRHPAMLINAATWVAEECARFDIPVRRLSAGEAQGGGRGVCQHVDLGSWGGGHWDCGPGFPIDDVLAMAGGKPPAHAAPAKRKGHNMIASTTTGRGYWCVKPDGAVYSFGDAQHKGGANDPDAGGPGTPHLSPGHEIVGIAGVGVDGYRLLADDGAIYCYGSASFEGRPDR